MGSLNQDFRYPKAFYVVIGFVFMLFITLFLFTITAVVGAFDTELYTPSVASIGEFRN